MLSLTLFTVQIHVFHFSFSSVITPVILFFLVAEMNKCILFYMILPSLFVCSYKWLGAETQKLQQETYHGTEHFVLVSYFSAYVNGHLKKTKTCSRIHLLYIMTSVSISYKCLHTVQGTNDKCQHTIQGTNDKCQHTIQGTNDKCQHTIQGKNDKRQHTIQRNKEAVVSNEPSCAKKEKEKKKKKRVGGVKRSWKKPSPQSQPCFNCWTHLLCIANITVHSTALTAEHTYCV